MKRAAVAPTVEQRFRKPTVGGSIPSRRANHLTDALLSLAATLAVGLTLVAALYVWAPVEWPAWSAARHGVESGP